MKVQGFVLMASLAVLPVAAVADEPGGEAFAGAAEMSMDELNRARGADSNTTIVSSHQDFDTVVQGNDFSVGHMNNGRITLEENAFGNFSGMGVNVLNTGNGNGFSVGLGVSVYLQ